MTINGFKSKASALNFLRNQGHKFVRLLSKPEDNPKVFKNFKVNVLTAPLHLAPFDLSGFQVCPQASQGCAAACLHTAGNPAYMTGKEASRKDKTKAYFNHREAFLALIAFEIIALEKKAAKLGMSVGIRLNATSDLPWEVRKVSVDGQRIALMDMFPDVQFYDYTKVTKRAIACAENRLPFNYHLTFSRTEDNDEDVAKVMQAGGNVAAVFSKDHISKLDWGFIRLAGELAVVIDGDEHDYRPKDPSGVVVALKAKGDAIGDTSGFVIN